MHRNTMDWNITFDGGDASANPERAHARWLGAGRVALERDNVVIDFRATEVFTSPRGSYLVQLRDESAQRSRYVYIGGGPLVMFTTSAPALAFRDRAETGPYLWDAEGVLYLPSDGAVMPRTPAAHEDFLRQRICVPERGNAYPRLWDAQRRRVGMSWTPDADAAFGELERTHGRLYLRRGRDFPAVPLTRAIHASLLDAAGIQPLPRRTLEPGATEWVEYLHDYVPPSWTEESAIEVFDADDDSSFTDETEDAAI
jgi:hypothetical protein